MPDYNFTLTIPADTQKDDPVIVVMNLMKGVIASGILQFPAGCHGFVHVIIADSKQQLYPANADETYHGDDTNIPLIGKHALDKAPYKLLIKGWSPDTDYDHMIQVSLSVLSEEEASPALAIRDLIRTLKRIIGLE